MAVLRKVIMGKNKLTCLGIRGTEIEMPVFFKKMPLTEFVKDWVESGLGTDIWTIKKPKLKGTNFYLDKLADIEGFSDRIELLEEGSFGDCYAVCCNPYNPDCEYTTINDPDATGDLCPECGERTVHSCLMIAGFI